MALHELTGRGTHLGIGRPSPLAKTRARRRLAGKAFTYAATVFVSVLFLLPLWVMVTVAIMPDDQIFSGGFQLFPRQFLWDHFSTALTYPEMAFLTYLKNSLLYSGISTVGAVISSAIVAYGFSRIHWPGRDAVFFVMVMTLMLPFAVQMIPLYVVFTDIHWINTLLPLIVPSFFGNAFYIFLLRQFMLSIPMELSEAARIDGASEWQTFLFVIAPIAAPALAVVGVFQLVNSWNDFFQPLIFISNPDNYTLPLGLQQFSTAHGQNWSILLAASTLFTIPMIVLFFLTQRLILRGLTLTGSLKG